MREGLSVITQSKGIDVLLPEGGGYKGADDTAVLAMPLPEHRALVSVERDFGKFGLKPEDMSLCRPCGCSGSRRRRKLLSCFTSRQF
jgi:hypothetical protein